MLTFNNDQEVFNYIVNTLRIQGGPSVVITETRMDVRPAICVYRAPNGRKCAAGQVISDEQFTRCKEGLQFSRLFSDLTPSTEDGYTLHPLHNLARFTTLICAMQAAHDKPFEFDVEKRYPNPTDAEWLVQFEAEAEKVAKGRNLVYTPPA